uniref:Si:ch211-207n2.7 n=1 Tax=Paramormyrops kingsleyae TaxID=1676925 RepID=A0A3B3RCX1_9TELE
MNSIHFTYLLRVYSYNHFILKLLFCLFVCLVFWLYCLYVSLARAKRSWKLPASLLGVLQAGKWEAISVVTQTGTILFALTLYSLNTWLYKLLTQIFVSQYRFPYAVQLAFAQALLMLAALSSLCSLGCLPLQPYSLHLGERLLVPAICQGAHAALALWAQANGAAVLHGLVERLLPLACTACSHALALTPSLSARSAVLLATAVLTSVSLTVMQASLWIDALICLYAALSLFLHSLSLCWLAKVGEGEAVCRGGGRRVSSLDLCFSMTINKSLVLGFLCLLHPDGAPALSEGSWQSLLFLAYLLGVLLLGALQHLLLAVAALRCSPVAAALLHTAQGLAEPLTSLL